MKAPEAKILISQSVLKATLEKIDFDLDEVSHVTMNGSKLTISTNTKSIDIQVTPLIFSPYIKQENRRWDWLYRNVQHLDEQPMVLEITESSLNLILQH